MRIISQNGKHDVPYELSSFHIDTYRESFGIIVKCNNYSSLFAIYSTEDKAKRVLEYIRNFYMTAGINTHYQLPDDDSVPTDEEMDKIIEKIINV